MKTSENSGGDAFYRAFEDRYRGSRELIKGRLTVYLPFLEPLRQVYPDAAAIDLGCGRGEWLEVLAEAGFKPIGVDLDHGMLQACNELGLIVVQGDAINYLAELPDESQAVVSAFHVVEHITFDELQTLVSQALRVLKPSGLLIMETPNPENLIVASKNFYLDPTHLRPIPSELLFFLAEHYGFARVKTIRLQEHPEILVNRLALFDVLSGASPDYAIVAQKKGSMEICAKFDPSFIRSYGIDLQSLADHYDQQAEDYTQWLKNEWGAARQRIEELSKSTGQLEAELKTANEHNAQLLAHAQWLQNEWDTAKQQTEELSKSTRQLEIALVAEQARTINLDAELKTANEHNIQLQAHAQWLQNELNAANAKLNELNNLSHHWWSASDQLNRELQSVYNSKSWRITWPLRKLMLFSKWFFSFPIRLMLWIFRLPKRVARRLLVKAMAFVLKRPGLKIGAINWLDKHPNLKTKLRMLAQAQGLIAGPLIGSQFFSEAFQPNKTSDTSLSSLSSNNKATLLSVEQILSRIRVDIASLDKDKQA